MELRHFLFIAGIAMAGVTLEGCTAAAAQQAKGQPQSDVELVVFANDFAMVNDVRNVSLRSGLNDVSLTGVSDMIDPSSAVYFWPEGKSHDVVSSTYERGLQSGRDLLAANIGKRVSLVYRGQDGRVAEREEGVLESANPGDIIVQVGDKHVFNPDATIEVPDSDGTATVPGLRAQIDSKSSGVDTLGVSYLTRGLSWSADYVAVLPADEEKMDLQAWATISNRTGTTFNASSIHFVAGSPNRSAIAGLSKDEGVLYSNRQMAELSKSADQKPRQIESLGELHAYPYEARATVSPNQDSRVEMLQANVGVSRDYAVRLSSLGSYYENYGRPEQRVPATLSIAFKNSEQQGLGSPLPAGKVRFYEPGKNSALRYIGAAGISDTPKDAKQTLTISNVFDVYAERTVSQATRVDKHTVSRTVSVTVHNEKDHAVDVRLVQDFYQNWKIATESVESKKISAQMAQWTVNVPSGGQVTLTYTVLLK
ncbi:MAG TPA: hypothetical protein VNI20_05345 [Fimbriimonadaceae bacterium]|nr:hypothetical protein [Fimbriimonadaceae bacterium]